MQDLKDAFNQFEPSPFQKQRMLENALKPRQKKRWIWSLVPVMLVICLVVAGWPKGSEEFSHSMMDVVFSFEYDNRIYIQTGELVLEEELGQVLGEIEVSEVSELVGSVIYESERFNHVIVEYDGRFELFRVEG